VVEHRLVASDCSHVFSNISSQSRRHGSRNENRSFSCHRRHPCFDSDKARLAPALRFILWSVYAAYLPLMSYVLSSLTTTLWSLDKEYQLWLLVSVVFLQFLKAKADMEALAVAAVASPVAGEDDVNSLKVRPTMVSLVYSFWVTGLIIYNIFFGKPPEEEEQPEKEKLSHVVYYIILLVVSPLWALGACRMVLKFVARLP
jgi:hypothetical protein